MSNINIENGFITFKVTLANIENAKQFQYRGAKVLNTQTRLGKPLRGIVINISNDNLTSPCIKVGSDSITFDLMLKNNLGWNKGDEVRVSFLNEIDYRDFEKLIPYFEARLRKFECNEAITEKEFLSYSDEWSEFHEDNPVDDVCRNKDKFSPIPRQTQDGGVVRIEELP